jgi:hypothetical protein
MSKRKQTPDVLADILGGEAATTDESPRRLASRDNNLLDAWEYRLVSFQDYHGWRPRYFNGRELKDWTNGPLIHDYIQSMGDEGWELVAASGGERLYGSADSHQLFFKRLK